jgi:hypothetical protein
MTAVALPSWHVCGTPTGLLDHIDVNYLRVRGPDNFSSLQGLSIVVHASGCVSLLLYVLLYEADL